MNPLRRLFLLLALVGAFAFHSPEAAAVDDKIAVANPRWISD